MNINNAAGELKVLALPLFYYPSTIAWIDDNNLFLETVTSILNSDYKIKSFLNPINCLNFFEGYTSPLTKISLLRSNVEHENYGSLHSTPVDFNVPSLRTIIQNENNQQEISVLIVDYEMPDMNGIELCKQLARHPAKKILLTGKTDHREAVKAFNDGIIDRFIEKDKPGLIEQIKLYINSLMIAYFSNRTLCLLAHLESDHLLPLSDPLFIDFFNNWRQKNNIKKYSLIDKNGSFLLIDNNNQEFYLIVHTNDSLNSFIELHDDVNYVEKTLNSIRLREKIPFFGIGKESWQFDCCEWENHLYTSNILKGREDYYWAFIGNPLNNSDI